jgi:hypothetical protein
MVLYKRKYYKFISRMSSFLKFEKKNIYVYIYIGGNDISDLNGMTRLQLTFPYNSQHFKYCTGDSRYTRGLRPCESPLISKTRKTIKV